MSDHPILFTSEMVRAILDERKSMTRRVIRPQPLAIANDWTTNAEPGDRVIYRSWPHVLRESRGRNKRDAGELTPGKVACPYGAPGDLLWVREEIRGDGQPGNRRVGIMRYGADGEMVLTGDDSGFRSDVLWSYKRPMLPGMLMRRRYSRLTLRVSNVRVERVQDITEDDAGAEGVPPNWCGELSGWSPIEHGYLTRSEQSEVGYYYTARESFIDLWDAINAKRGYSWESNPWVWVVEWDKVWRENVDAVKEEANAE